jgi:hypothetical protein
MLVSFTTQTHLIFKMGHDSIIKIMFLNLIKFSLIQDKMSKRYSKTILIKDFANEHFKWLSYA